MKRLLKDAEALSGKEFDLSSYADIVEAIHLIQEEMGIAGTTGQEAVKTISGSLSAMKAAFSNMMTALVLGGDDFETCLDNLIESARTFGKNIMPAVLKALKGMGELVEELAPVIEKEFPALAEELLPPLLKAASSLLKALIAALPGLIRTVIQEIPDILREVGAALGEAFGDLPGMGKVENFFGRLAGFFTENQGTIKKIAPIALALVAGLKIFGKLKGLTSVFGGGGGLGILKGLMGVAIALGGATAVVAAFGALAHIDGIQEFLSGGGALLSEIFRVIGECAGSLIGGIGEGVTSSLPAMGNNLSAFATAIVPMIDTFSGMDFGGLERFASAFGSFVMVMAGDALLSWFTGGIDYGKIGSDLTALITNGAGFFTAVQGIPEAAFASATALFQCLNGIGLLPNSGGVVQWFTGTVDYAGIASGLSLLAGTTGFFAAVQGIPEAAFASATALFQCLNGIGLLPNSGGLMQWFAGETDYAGMAAGLKTLTGQEMIAAFNAISNIPASAYAGLTSLFNTLSGVSALPTEGGIFGWFTGSSTEGLTAVAAQLPGVAANIASFFTNLGGRTDFTPIASLFNTLGGIEIDASSADKGIFGWGTSAFEALGTGLSNFAANAKAFFEAVDGMDGGNLSAFFEQLGTAGDLPGKLSGLNGTLGTVLSEMVALAKTRMGEIITAVQTGMAGAVSAIRGAYQSLYNAGAHAMGGAQAGMRSKQDALVTTARNMASAINSAFNSTLDIHSPSRVMFDSGKFVGQGAIQGMESTIPGLRAAATKMAYASMPFDAYSPESGVTYNSGGNSEYMNVSPVFNLTITGSQDDRAMARKVKRYVAEAINETFESLGRKNGTAGVM